MGKKMFWADLAPLLEQEGTPQSYPINVNVSRLVMTIAVQT